MAVPAAELAERVQDVRVEPDVGISEAVGAHARVPQGLEREICVAVGPGHECQAASGHALPARIADLAGAGERLLEGLGRPGRILAREVHLTLERLRPRLER